MIFWNLVFFDYICIVIFNLLIPIFMRNSLILGHFFDFLYEQDLLVSYLRNVMTIGERFPELLQTLFSKFKPDIWLTGAFDWDQDPLIDWRAINDNWLVRVNVLKSKYPFND